MLKIAFRMIDADGNGVLVRRELLALLKRPLKPRPILSLVQPQLEAPQGVHGHTVCGRPSSPLPTTAGRAARSAAVRWEAERGPLRGCFAALT